MMKGATTQEMMVSTLPGVPADIYGVHHSDHTLEMYKLYVLSADRISDRREKANSFFVTINAAIIALMAKGAAPVSTLATNSNQILVSFAGIVICYVWYRLIRSYRDLNFAKFQVVHEIEKSLPLRPFDAEWELVGRGKASSLYRPFTHVETVVPWLFFLFHIGALLTSLPG